MKMTVVCIFTNFSCITKSLIIYSGFLKTVVSLVEYMILLLRKDYVTSSSTSCFIEQKKKPVGTYTFVSWNTKGMVKAIVSLHAREGYSSCLFVKYSGS